MQIFFLQGRFIFGPDVRSLVLTIFLIVAPVTIFCVFVARKLMDDFSHHLGISIMVVAVAFTFYVSSLFPSLSTTHMKEIMKHEHFKLITVSVSDTPRTLSNMCRTCHLACSFLFIFLYHWTLWRHFMDTRVLSLDCMSVAMFT